MMEKQDGERRDCRHTRDAFRIYVNATVQAEMLLTMLPPRVHWSSMFSFSSPEDEAKSR
jgi:hypothetical protein